MNHIGKVGRVLVLALLVPIIAIVGAILATAGVLLLTPNNFLQYVIIVIVSLLTGWLVKFILHRTSVSAKTGVVTGMIAPMPAIAFLRFALPTANAITQQIPTLSEGSPRANMLSIFAEAPPELSSAIIFYVLFNAFILYTFIKHKDRSMVLYLLAPVAFIIAYGIGSIILSILIGPV